MVLAAGAVVGVLDSKHGVGGVDRQGEAQQDGQVPLVVVQRGRGVGRAIQHETRALGLLGCLLRLQLLDDAEESLMIRVARLEAR